MNKWLTQDDVPKTTPIKPKQNKTKNKKKKLHDLPANKPQQANSKTTTL